MEKMRLFFLFLLVINTLQSFGQQRANVWYFGVRGAGLDFSCAPPMPVQGGMYYSTESCASISDTSGSILFYTNGDSVYNRYHYVMPNGFGIGQDPGCWSSSTQGALIIPAPDSDSLYYIFTTDCIGNNLANGLRYSTVDMSLNGGLGEVVVKSQPLRSSVTEKLAAVHHANGKDIWVLVHEHGTNSFFAYLVDSTGLDTIPVISNSGQVHWLPTHPMSMARGYMKFSPNAQKLILVSISDQHNYSIYPELFTFDDATGQVTLDYTIIDPDSINYYGATFSPDNQLLYLSGGWKGQYVHQFDANAGSSVAFLSSKHIVFTTSVTGYAPSALQTGPDGKIYVVTHQPWIDVIEYPNTPGSGCVYQSQKIQLSDCPLFSTSLFGLPNYPESYFRSTITGAGCVDTINTQFSYSDTCMGFPTYFFDNTYIFPDSAGYWEWNFGDSLSGTGNFSSLQNPTHTYLSAGVYNVMLITSTDINNLCKTDTIVKTVNIAICTGIEEKNNPILTKIYPNPFSNNLSVTINNFLPSYILLYDVVSRSLLKTSFTNSSTINTEELSNGIYIYEIGNKDGLCKRGKVVKE